MLNEECSRCQAEFGVYIVGQPPPNEQQLQAELLGFCSQLNHQAVTQNLKGLPAEAECEQHTLEDCQPAERPAGFACPDKEQSELCWPQLQCTLVLLSRPPLVRWPAACLSLSQSKLGTTASLTAPSACVVGWISLLLRF